MKAYFPTYNINVITNNNLQKCKKCRKNLPSESFINENTCQFKTCNIYYYKTSLQYEQSN